MVTLQGELNQKLLEDLLAIQIKAEEKMLEKVAKRVKRNVTTPGWNEQKLKDVQSLRQDILKILNNKNKIEKTGVQKSILKAYETGKANVSKILKKPETVIKDLVPLHLQHLILETNNAIAGTSFQILRNVDDEYRDIIGEVSSGVLIGTDTRMQVAQEALNNFAAKGITGFVDKAGRNWQLASYVEMATRTANSRAALQGHVDRSLELDQDLMMVSGHAATCPICEPWGNKVISITGKTPGYPTLADAQAAGLFHPNCKHTLTVWFEDLPGNIEHAEQYTERPNPEMYQAIQRQRYNERMIREWKRREVVAITPEAKLKASNKVKEWQAIQREHIKQFDLRRKYQRESIRNRTGDATKASVKPDISKVWKPKEEIKDVPNPHPEPPKVETIKETKSVKKELMQFSGEKVNYTLDEVKGLNTHAKKYLLVANENMSMVSLKNLSDKEIDKKVVEMFNKAKTIEGKDDKEIIKELGVPKYTREDANKVSERKLLDDLGYGLKMQEGEFYSSVLRYVEDNNMQYIPSYKELIENYKDLPSYVKNKLNHADVAELKYERGTDKWRKESLKTLKNKIVKQFGKEDGNEYFNKIINRTKNAAPDRIEWLANGRNNFKGFIDTMEDRGGFHQNGEVHVNFKSDINNIDKTGELTTFLHEYGHMLDSTSLGNNVKLSQNQEYYDKILEDFNKHIKPNFNTIRSELIRDDLSSGIQDTMSGISAITEGDNRYHIKWGHSTDYWKRKGTNAWKEVTSETFAQMNVALFNKDVESYYEKYLPEAYKMFKDMINVK